MSKKSAAEPPRPYISMAAAHRAVRRAARWFRAHPGQVPPRHIREKAALAARLVG